jgi:FkbM family methyltransferase
MIQFFIRGAKRVIGFEMLPYRHALAVKNIYLNGMDKSCLAVNVAVGGKKGKIALDPYQKSSEFYGELVSIAKGGESAIRVAVVTLDDIVKKYKVEKASIVKSDLQGGEYEVFMNASDDTLRTFSLIVIRSYYLRDTKVKEFQERFRSAGFDCRYYKPEKWGCGYLVARNQNLQQ